MIKNKTISITGGTGFIGSKLVEQLIDNNEIRILSRNTKLKNPKIKYFNFDISDQNHDYKINKFVDGSDILFNCAAELYDEKKMERLHIEGTKNLIKACLGKNIKWVQLSSVGAFGFRKSGVINENTEESPVNFYEKTKTRSDQLIKQSNINFTILRPSIVFGDGMKSNLLIEISKILRRKMFFYLKKNSMINLVHIKDVINALNLCAFDERANNCSYILSQKLSIEELIQSICDGMKISEPKLTFPELPIRFLVKIFENIPNFPLTTKRINVLTSRCFYDSSKIKNDLDFKFHSNLKKLLRNYAKSI